MSAPSTLRRRRQVLWQRLQRPILLMGNSERPRNLPMTPLPFRQDSTLLYFTGCRQPGAAALIDGERCRIFTPLPGPEDALWHGPATPISDLREALGVDEVLDAGGLAAAVAALRDAGRTPATLAVADAARTALAARWTGTDLSFGKRHGDAALVEQVIAMRRQKDVGELAELRQAAAHTGAAHIAVARALHVGGHERTLAALFDAVLAARDCVTGYKTILSQQGEILHNHRHDGVLREGALLLVDGGAELPGGYGADVTRTWPVGGVFVGRQRAAYEAVLSAQNAAIDRCRPGVWYRDVHDAASLEIARFLKDEGLLKIRPEEAVESGAHGLFFPHGVGHLLGLDVHDLENFGDLPSYPKGMARPAQFGTRNLRLNLQLEPGWVVTVEPGFYVVPAILGDAALRQRFAGQVDFERAEAWLGFGGIRIEDDIAITTAAPENLTAEIPRAVTEIEALVGAGPPAEVLLGTAITVDRAR